MSDGRRVQRIEKELQHIVATYLLRGFKGQLQGLVSVSRVESNPKLRTAKVYVSIMGSDQQKEASMEQLNDCIRDVQQHVNKQLHMKFVPRISFQLDQGLERLLKVETLLREIAKTQPSRTDDESPKGDTNDSEE